MSKKKFSGNISGKGYYIALILCAVAIGISGYFYYRNTNKQETKKPEENPSQQVSVNPQNNEDVQTAVTKPGDNTQQPDNNPSQQQKQEGKPTKTMHPVQGEAITPYCMDALCYNQTTRDWRVHDGVDYAAQAGTQVCAAADGTVSGVYADDTMGTTVIITHSGGYATTYASLGEQVSVAVGDSVSAGQVIGTVGQTALMESALGEHMHFAVVCNGKSVDPAQFLPAQ
jgi:murein DD-endopeptidase MepM/ murein hydrolase activator NlpD